MKINFTTKWLFYALLCLMIFGRGSMAAGTLETQKHVLENGLTVLISEMPSSSSVSVYGLVKTGSASEGEYLGSGLSHFMEHMLFKGTQRRGVGDIPEEIQALGGTINASTHLDYTIYTLTVPKQHFEQAVDILTDMLMCAAFDPAEIEREREVVFGEMRMYDDRPERYLSEKVFETVYKRHPYRIPVIGFEDLLRPLKREDFLRYYKEHYQPNNIVVSLAGDVAPQEALAVVRNFWEKYPRGPYTTRSVEQEPNQLSQRIHQESYATELLRMSLSYQGVDVLDEDMVALDALSMVLGAGQSSRLYKSLYEDKHLVHSISASDFTPYDRGLFEIEISADHDRWQDIVQAVDAEIDRLIRDGVQDDELEKMISSTMKSQYMGDLTSDGVAYRTAVDEGLTGKCDFTQWYLNAFAGLTSDDIVRVAKKYLRSDRRSVVFITPKEWDAQAKNNGVKKKERHPIEKITLSNGLRVLLRPDDTVPMVWLNLVLDGGVYEDPESLEGLCNLVSTVWIKGSRQFSKEDIARMTELKGVGLSSFSGRQSFGIQLNLLRRDLDFSLRLLSDLVLNPAFLDDEITNEKKYIDTAIISRDNSISDVASILFYQTAFAGHPLSRTQLGVKESIARITRKDILAFYKQKVVPSHAVLSVFGDFDPETMKADLERYLGKWKNTARESVSRFPEAAPVTEPQEKIQLMDKEQAVVVFGFQAESFYHTDRPGLELLGAILGSPFKGKMFQSIREQKGLAYHLGGGFVPARNTGALVFSVQTAPETIGQVKDAFDDIVRDVALNGVSSEELESIKAYLIGRHQRSMDTDDSMSFLISLDELYGMGYADYQDYAQRINDIRPQDIQRLAGKYLDLNHMVTITILPEEDFHSHQADGENTDTDEI